MTSTRGEDGEDGAEAAGEETGEDTCAGAATTAGVDAIAGGAFEIRVAFFRWAPAARLAVERSRLDVREGGTLARDTRFAARGGDDARALLGAAGGTDSLTVTSAFFASTTFVPTGFTSLASFASLFGAGGAETRFRERDSLEEAGAEACEDTTSTRVAPPFDKGALEALADASGSVLPFMLSFLLMAPRGAP